MYIYDGMTSRSLDISQDAKLAHLFEEVLIDKEFLTTKIAVQELFRGYRKQSMAERELRLQERRKKVPNEPEKNQKVEAPDILPSISARGSGMKRQAENPPDDPRLEQDISIPEIEEEARGTKRRAEEVDDMETEVTNLLLAQRRGFLGALQAGDSNQKPVCEDDLGIDPEAPVYWDNISGKPLSTEKVEEARTEEMVHVLVHGCFTSVYLFPQNPFWLKRIFIWFAIASLFWFA